MILLPRLLMMLKIVGFNLVLCRNSILEKLYFFPCMIGRSFSNPKCNRLVLNMRYVCVPILSLSSCFISRSVMAADPSRSPSRSFIDSFFFTWTDSYQISSFVIYKIMTKPIGLSIVSLVPSYTGSISSEKTYWLCFLPKVSMF